MKKRWSVLIFAAGLLLGWLIRGDRHPAPEVEAANLPVSKATRRHEVAATPTAHPAKWPSIGKQALRFNDNEREDFLKNLAPKDRLQALETLAAQSGPDGLDWRLRGMIQKILKELADQDFDSAWSWSKGIASEATRHYMMESLLKELVKANPDRALALHLEQLAADPNFTSGVPHTLVAARVREGAQAMLDLFAKFPAKSGGGSGSDMKFPQDFDFQLLADGIRKMTQGTDSLPAYPMNFLSAWAARDPEAAYAYWSGGGLPSWFGGWDRLIEGIETHGEAGAAAAWTVSKLADPSAPRRKIIGDLTNAIESGRMSKINSIAQAMPDAGVRDRFFTDVLVMNQYTDPVAQLGFAFQGLSAPQARLDAIREISAAGRKVDLKKTDAAGFQAWGFTREQAEQMIAAGNQDRTLAPPGEHRFD